MLLLWSLFSPSCFYIFYHFDLCIPWEGLLYLRSFPLILVSGEWGFLFVVANRKKKVMYVNLADQQVINSELLLRRMLSILGTSFLCWSYFPGKTLPTVLTHSPLRAMEIWLPGLFWKLTRDCNSQHSCAWSLMSFVFRIVSILLLYFQTQRPCVLLYWRE